MKILTAEKAVNTPLQGWFDQWLVKYKETTLFAYQAALEQILFVRDGLTPIVWAGIPYALHPREDGERGDCLVSARVIGEQRSKSVILPVYQFERADLSLRLTLSNNFYDWRLSVESERPIWSDLLPCLFQDSPPKDPDCHELTTSHFNGFPVDRIFGYYSQNPRRWSASIHGQHRLWTVIWICMRSAGVILPMTHND